MTRIDERTLPKTTPISDRNLPLEDGEDERVVHGKKTKHTPTIFVTLGVSPPDVESFSGWGSVDSCYKCETSGGECRIEQGRGD